MTPIINPWWFYLFNLIENLLNAAFFSIVILGFIYFLGITYGLICNDGEMPSFIKSLLMKAYLIFCLICTITLPSKETMYQMAAASLITPNNITSTTDFVTDTINTIVDAVDEALED